MGFVSGTSGRDWLVHDYCPFCMCKLKKLGSYHTDSFNIGTNKSGDNSLCLNCFCKNIEIDKGIRPRYEDDGVILWKPLKLSPALSCLFEVAVCEKCGWWYAIEDADQCNDGYAANYSAIIETFDLTSSKTPIEILETELSKNIKKIHNIDAKKMEDLVSDILKGIHDCEVHQLGYTRDGGIDLILLKSDKPIAVQVKRRSLSRKTESVSEIRNFLAAAQLKQFKHLMFVTTANKYSSEAEEAANKAIDLKLVNSFELISIDKLNNLLHDANLGNKSWRVAFDAASKKEYKVPNVPDPFLNRFI